MTWITWDPEMLTANHNQLASDSAESKWIHLNEVARKFKAALIETEYNRSRMADLFAPMSEQMANALAHEMHRQSERMRIVLNDSFPESMQIDKPRFIDSIRELEACFGRKR